MRDPGGRPGELKLKQIYRNPGQLSRIQPKLDVTTSPTAQEINRSYTVGECSTEQAMMQMIKSSIHAMSSRIWTHNLKPSHKTAGTTERLTGKQRRPFLKNTRDLANAPAGMGRSQRRQNCSGECPGAAG